MRSSQHSPSTDLRGAEAVATADAGARAPDEQGQERPVLVVSPDRADAVPVLEQLLRGEPKIEIVVDRRTSERRNDTADAPCEADRRESQRRREASLYLV